MHEKTIIQTVVSRMFVMFALLWNVLPIDVANAVSFTLNQASAIKATNPPSVPLTKDIVATGYGMNEEQALKNAFRAAIQQYIGVVIDSTSMVKNGTLIDDTLLTASSGYIQTYKKLSISTQDGMVMVKVLATVQSQKLLETIHELNISTVNVTGSKKAAARIVTKQIAKKDAVNMIEKTWSNAWNDQALLELLSVNIDAVKILEDHVGGEGLSKNQVPLKIAFSISVDREKYKQKIAALETLFRQLGAKQEKRFDLPKMSRQGYLKSSIPKRVGSSSSIAIMKHYGKGLVVDVWRFPATWQVKKQLNGMLFDKFHLTLEVKDTNGNVLYPKAFIMQDRATLFWGACHWGDSQSCSYRANHATLEIVTPFLSPMGVFLYPHEKKSYSIQIPVDIEDVKKIDNITLELEHQ